MANIGKPVKGHYGFNWGTTSDEVVTTLKDKIDGKIILITGVSPGGLGAQTALSLATASPALLILAGRDASKLTQLQQALPAGTPSRLFLLDLSSLASVRTAAESLLTDPAVPRIDVLINNAAVMANPYSTTADGFEQQFGVNHLGHFLLTNLLMPKILAAGPGARVVNVSSAGHRFTGIRWEDTGFQNGAAYDPWLGYGQSKTANILFSVALAQKLKDKGVLSFSLHPGPIETNIGRYISPEYVERVLKGIPWKNMQQGAATQLVAAFDDTIAGDNGAYLEDCNISQAKEHARDPKDAERLWALSEELVKQRFEY